MRDEFMIFIPGAVLFLRELIQFEILIGKTGSIYIDSAH